jgi:proteic killer suppression protein
MRRRFKCEKTEALFVRGEGGDRSWQSFAKIARRKLVMVHGAAILGDLKAPPNNRLKPLRGNRQGQYAIRINDQYRVCFIWTEDGAHEIEIVDYH